MALMSFLLSAVLFVSQPIISQLPSLFMPLMGGGPLGSHVEVTAPSPTAVIAAASPAVVRIETDFELVEGQLVNSTGTGFFITGQHILTNAHVVADHKTVSVTVYKSEGKTQFLVGEVLATDPVGDMALIRVPLQIGQQTLSLAKDLPYVGTPVVVIGFPYTQWRASQGTITGGAFGASLSASHRGPLAQTDAAIDPGNSGGPVVNMENNEVVGMASAQIAGADGMGFAIPSTTLGDFYNRVLEGKTQEYQYLGIRIAHINPVNEKVLCQTLPLPCAGESGVVATWVEPLSPGAHGGLQAGDIIMAWNGAPLNVEEDLFPHLIGHPGPVSLKVKRMGQVVHLNVETMALGAHPAGVL